MDTKIELKEAVQLGAVDASFFGHFFFPKACRQATPEFHEELDLVLDSANDRYVSAMIARDFAKTTKVRLYMARRVAYRISRTIVIAGKSQEAAAKSLSWLMKAVQNNKLYAQTFGLRKGSKWTATEMEIIAETFGEDGEVRESISITIIAVGMTGSLRGINVDDYRPDLIICDDPCDEENTATPEQRKKMADLFFGALQKTLAPASECPFAKMILLQTVLNKEDLVSVCTRDEEWTSLVFSVFAEDDEGNLISRWPERYPLEVLLADKAAHIRRNQLPLWLREKECKVVSEETASFLERQLQFWHELPKGGRRCLAIDPTPPPREGSTSLNPKLDDAVIMAMQVTKGQFYVLEYRLFKSPDPLEFISEIFTMARKWKIKLCGFETVLFQRVMSFVFRRQMREERFWLTVQEVEDRRNKRVRIVQELSGVVGSGDLFIRPDMLEFIEQFTQYPDVNHDDILDACTIGVLTLTRYAVIEEDWMEGEFEVIDPEDKLGQLEWKRGAP